MIKKNLANFITCIRIIGTVVMLFLVVSTKEFLIVYIIAGVSDVVDGFVARKLHTVSKFGSKLDSVSDIIYYIVMMIKIWPYLILPPFMWVVIWIIVGIRITTYLAIFFIKGKLMSTHSYFNKVSSIMFFVLPFALLTNYFFYYVCAIVTVCAISAAYDIYLVFKKDKLVDAE